MKALHFSVFTLIILLASCNPFNKQNPSKEDSTVDAFYTDRGNFGTYPRIPLIKPYEAIKVSGKEWRIELQITKDLLALSIHNVREINVQDSMILVYSKGGTSIKHRVYNEAWLIIVPSQNLEKGFAKKEDFLSYLKTQNINEPKLHNPDLVYDKFNKIRKIEWGKEF